MCNFSEEVWEDGWNEGRAEGLVNVMRNMSLSLEAAMKAMGIPAKEKSKYEALIATML